jgi:hypothetical protein
MAELYLYLRCPLCNEQTILPDSTLQEPLANRRRMPKDTWKSGFVCWHCGRSSLVTAEMVREHHPERGTPSQHHADISFYSVKLQCAEPNCESRVEVLVSSRGRLTESAAGEEALRGAWSYHCQNSHRLSNAAKVAYANQIYSVF